MVPACSDRSHASFTGETPLFREKTGYYKFTAVADRGRRAEPWVGSSREGQYCEDSEAHIQA